MLLLHEAFSIHRRLGRTLFQCCVDQVRLVHLIFQTMVPRERVQNLVGKQIVDVPVSKILVEIVEPVAYRRQATARVDVHFPVLRILEQIVEVIEVILQEQCQ